MQRKKILVVAAFSIFLLGGLCAYAGNGQSSGRNTKAAKAQRRQDEDARRRQEEQLQREQMRVVVAQAPVIQPAFVAQEAQLDKDKVQELKAWLASLEDQQKRLKIMTKKVAALQLLGQTPLSVDCSKLDEKISGDEQNLMKAAMKLTNIIKHPVAHMTVSLDIMSCTSTIRSVEQDDQYAAIDVAADKLPAMLHKAWQE